MSALQFALDAFLEAARQEEDFTNAGEFEPSAEAFLSQFYNDAMENEFLDYRLDDLIALARDLWMFGDLRKPGEILLDVSTAATPLGSDKRDTAIKVITDDMSFLVDSLASAVSAMGVNVNGLFHPIAEGARLDNGRWVMDASGGEDVVESMILIMVSPQTKRQQTRLKEELSRTLNEVRAINTDFLPLVQSVRSVAEELKHSSAKIDTEDKDEAVAFLDWLADGNFVLFGARRYDFTKSAVEGKDGPDYAQPLVVEGQSLGLLRDPSVQILRQSSEPAAIASNVKAFLEQGGPVTVAKSNVFTRVHRRVRMDYISVKHYSKTGNIVGETRYIGLFTSEAYNRSPRFVPLLRRKVEQVLKQSRWPEGSHSAKRLDFVLSTYPRDELFQTDTEELLRISTGVAQAFDRPRARLFVRRDRFDRFASALVYVPREQYNTRVRERIGHALKTAFNGRVSAFYPQYNDSALARVHFIIGMNPDTGAHPDLAALENDIALIAKPWLDGVGQLAEDNEAAQFLISQYQGAFSLSYQDVFSPAEALADIVVCETLTEDNPIDLKMQPSVNTESGTFRAKIYQRAERLEPSRVMPVFENYNCHIVQETGYKVSRKNEEVVWIHDFEFRLDFTPDNPGELAKTFEAAFLSTWKGLNEDDGFNRLILPQNANWRDIAFLRLIAAYRRQTGLDPSQATQIEALERYPALTRKLLAMFHAKFDPAAFADGGDRRKAVEAIKSDILAGLNDVSSLDHDRVIRRLCDLIEAGLRTNFYQMDDDGAVKSYISLKIASDGLSNLPAPSPYREIYVSSPRIDGVHLRFGPVARGGLRWSDRRDDFRTEVLGLVKAQQVKNAVIVPVGSKGGFFPKQLPKGGSRADVQAEAIEAYKIFISGLLDLTDNYVGKGTVPPKDVVCWDAPDPYLVVAADKGTATFSDIANGISQKYGFWLDDAFASGGSVGYDHKAMGITARGGWEAVKRHFREVGKDIQSEDFTVIGVGDMSGDVFGNGMLLSKHIKLQAAFNHLHVFVDPDPDPALSFKERERMFALPRSTWDDYDKNLISKGGGVFSRAEKSIELTPEIKELTGLSADNVTPDELIKALLKAQAELLWFGGIGTYIKSTGETNGDVGDKANDNLRINGRDVRAKVIGEGANLGLTQAGRIEFARKGGRLNTDAIDNSAGVDSSDNEVNIKILTGGAIENKSLKRDDRNALLASMTDDVAHLVLQHNYDQTGALSLAESRVLTDHDAYERLMVSLEKVGRLNRTVEGLPGTQSMKALAAAKDGLTRPEIAVLMAYSKNRLFDDVIKTDVADDPFMMKTLVDYFPPALHEFDGAMDGHRLKREIITSRLINRMVDVGGPVFTLRLQEQTQGSLEDIAKAFIVAFESLGIASLKAQIAELDNKVAAKAQTKLHDEIAQVLYRVSALLVRRGESGSLDGRINSRKVLSEIVDNDWLELLSPYDKRRARSRIQSYVKAGIPETLAQDVALLRSRASGFDVLALSEKTGWPMEAIAPLFYDVGGRFKIDRIRASILETASGSHWERLALRHLQEDFFKAQVRFTSDVADWHKAQGGEPQTDMGSELSSWVKSRVPQIKAYEETVSAMSRAGGWTVSKYAIVNAQLSDLMSGLD